MHTDPNGAVAATYISLPFGDGGSATVNETYAGWDFNRFGDMDYQAESATQHAQYRQYSDAQGRWMQPDPYSGSYDFSNPQSFNRYAYVTNNPLSFIDPTGQNEGGGFCSNILYCVVAAAGLIFELDSLFGGSSFHGTLTPRPNSDPWSERDAATGITSLGVPPSALGSPQGALGAINQAIGLPSTDAGCDFGACGDGGAGFTNNSTSLVAPILTLPSWVFGLLNSLHLPYADPSDANHRLFGTHYCGPGGGGSVTGPLDAACKAHDICYSNGSLQWYDNFNPANLLNSRGGAIQNCNQQLCNATTSIPGAAAGTVRTYFQQTGMYACKPF
jgi:RHS repeat-associated protein